MCKKLYKRITNYKKRPRTLKDAVDWWPWAPASSSALEAALALAAFATALALATALAAFGSFVKYLFIIVYGFFTSCYNIY